MKKIVNLVVALLSIFVLYGCATNKDIQTLQVPTNVKINEEGLITWDEVNNATTYVVTINGETYIASTNSFQVKNINENFSFTVRAEAVGYKTSSETESIEYIGKAVAEINKIYEYTLSITIGNREDADDVEAYDKNNQLIKEACTIAYEHGVTYEIASSIVNIILDESVNNKDNIPGFIASLVLNFVGLNNDQVVGLVYYGDYVTQVKLNSLATSFAGSEIETALQGINELLVRNDYEIADALANIIIQCLKVYRQGTVQVLPKLQKLLGSSNNQEIAYNAVQLKEAIVKVLLDNVVSNEDLAVVLDFAKDAVLVAAPIVSSLVTDNEKLANVIAQVVEVMKGIDSLEVAGAITDLYKAFLNSLDYITEVLVAKALEYEDTRQIIGYIVLQGIKNIIPEITITSDDLKLVIDLIWYEVGVIIPDLKDVSLMDIINISEEKYNELLGTVAKLFNDDYKAFRDFITSDETIKAIVEALKFRVVEGKLSPDQSVSVKIEEVANDKILSKVFEKYGISSVDELVVGKTYKILGVHKFGESFITIKSYSVTITNISSEEVTYYYENVAYTVENIDSLLPILDKMIELFETESITTIENLKAIIKVVVDVDFVSDETIKSILTVITNFKEEDIKVLIKDLATLTKSLVSFVKEVGVEEFINDMINGDIQAIFPFFNEENIATIKLLANDLATTLDNAKAFPMNYVFGEGDNSFTLTFESKDEFIETMNQFIEMLESLNRAE
ncbi:putative uncharacterized protein [Firmicutes bacterium CAG:313]|nr:putative uncharacterized protein [Firmicutes bacterium CAG:313]